MSPSVGNPDRAIRVQDTPDAALADGEQDAARLGASPQFPRPVYIEKQQRRGGDSNLCLCYGPCGSQSARLSCCKLKVRMCVCARAHARHACPSAKPSTPTTEAQRLLILA